MRASAAPFVRSAKTTLAPSLAQDSTSATTAGATSSMLSTGMIARAAPPRCLRGTALRR